MHRRRTSREPTQEKMITMSEHTINAELIMGFVKWRRLNMVNLDLQTDTEMEYCIDQYMRSLVAAG